MIQAFSCIAVSQAEYAIALSFDALFMMKR